MLPTIALGSFHTAHLDPVSGYGLVVCPRPQDDVVLDGASLMIAAWDHACEALSSLGWAAVRDDAGNLSYLGANDEGRLVVEARSMLRSEIAPDAETMRTLFRQTGIVAPQSR